MLADFFNSVRMMYVTGITNVWLVGLDGAFEAVGECAGAG
tara:strand:- start:385 stop:504 length:120 start_codon:yes stop_codon:yes gene_type:complete